MKRFAAVRHATRTCRDLFEDLPDVLILELDGRLKARLEERGRPIPETLEARLRHAEQRLADRNDRRFAAGSTR